MTIYIEPIDLHSSIHIDPLLMLRITIYIEPIDLHSSF